MTADRDTPTTTQTGAGTKKKPKPPKKRAPKYLGNYHGVDWYEMP